MSDLSTFKKEGAPVYVPGNTPNSRVLKGWELDDEFMQNPDYVEPTPPKPSSVSKIINKCVQCGTEENLGKGIRVQGGVPHVVHLCDKHIQDG